MKKSPFLIIIGAAIALLSSCTSSGLFVINDVGDPLDGVVLEPVALTYGCKWTNSTGPCGHAGVCQPQRVNLRRVGYHSVLGVEVHPERTTYVQMEATGLGGSDHPRYWSGSWACYGGK